jgi:hypothetical protein
LAAAADARSHIARAQDEYVEGIVFPGDDEPVGVRRVNALAVGVDEVHVWLVEGLEVLVTEGRAFAPEIKSAISPFP